MLPAARCTLHVAATASAERNLRCTFQFPATRNGNGKGDTRHRTLGTVSQWTCVADCGMQLSKRKSSPHPRGHDALGAGSERAVTSVKMIVDSRVRICGLILAYFVTCRVEFGV